MPLGLSVRALSKDDLPWSCVGQFDSAVGDVVVGHLHQVTDTASDEALEDKDIALHIQLRFVMELGVIKLVALFLGQVERRAINCSTDYIVVIQVPLRYTRPL